MKIDKLPDCNHFWNEGSPHAYTPDGCVYCGMTKKGLQDKINEIIEILNNEQKIT